LPRRVKCGGPEGEIVVAHGCWKRKKLICGPEGEIVVAHGRLPYPAHGIRFYFKLGLGSQDFISLAYFTLSI